MPEIRDLEFDDENEEKLFKRGINPEDVLDVLAQPHVLIRNKKKRRGQYKLIGRDASGRAITVILEPTHWKTTWRPVTGWKSTRAEARYLTN